MPLPVLSRVTYRSEFFFGGNPEMFMDHPREIFSILTYFCRACQKYLSTADFAYLRVFFTRYVGIASFDIPSNCGGTASNLVCSIVISLSTAALATSPLMADTGQHLSASTCQRVYSRVPCARNALYRQADAPSDHVQDVSLPLTETAIPHAELPVLRTMNAPGYIPLPTTVS